MSMCYLESGLVSLEMIASQKTPNDLSICVPEAHVEHVWH